MSKALAGAAEKYGVATTAAAKALNDWTASLQVSLHSQHGFGNTYSLKIQTRDKHGKVSEWKEEEQVEPVYGTRDRETIERVPRFTLPAFSASLGDFERASDIERDGDAPDVLGYVEGYRQWVARHEGSGAWNLIPIAVATDRHWIPGANRAQCERGRPWGDHTKEEVPVTNCGCGYWAVLDYRNVPNYGLWSGWWDGKGERFQVQDFYITGKVKGWGPVVEARKGEVDQGWRSRYAQIVELYLNGLDLSAAQPFEWGVDDDHIVELVPHLLGGVETPGIRVRAPDLRLHHRAQEVADRYEVPLRWAPGSRHP